MGSQEKVRQLPFKMATIEIQAIQRYSHFALLTVRLHSTKIGLTFAVSLCKKS